MITNMITNMSINMSRKCSSKSTNGNTDVHLMIDQDTLGKIQNKALSFAGSRGATHRNSKKSTSTARDRSQRPSGVNIVHGVELDVSTGRESRSGSTSWVKSAFDGVLGLTVGTRDILMGTSPNSANSQHREVKVPEVDFYEENKGDESSPRNHSGTRKSKRKDDLLSKYRQGFEDLSDLDDSDDSARPPARFERPMTRSQARKK
eukprot:CAMPEP_0171535404 /NCGR_PEP_ID=MMETSP0959-20130129/17080_1 /TAXON_ID=87120 /ORGANISM="Aurantiochytrium limacinum, Strain ATCCMYA-1381" /LENGTH=204 /DNA_ID=CAMNT_0012081235 /DNA_START=30 /DNA_END=644 /DNA_ORIENTATION=-